MIFWYGSSLIFTYSPLHPCHSMLQRTLTNLYTEIIRLLSKVKSNTE